MAKLVIDVHQPPQAPAELVVALRGSGDMLGTADLERALVALSASRPRGVVFDLVDLDMVSSIFMGAMVKFRNGVVHSGGRVVIARAQPLVLAAFKRAQLDRMFPIHETLEAALEPAATAGFVNTPVPPVAR